MRIGIPTVEGELCGHFEGCETLTVFNVDLEAKIVGPSEELTPPDQIEAVPAWLASQGIQAVIVRGADMKVQGELDERGIKLITGGKQGAPQDVVKAYVEGRL